MRRPVLILILSASSCGIASAQSDANSTTVGNAILELASNQAGNGNTNAVGSFVNFHAPKENTKGRRMLLADWARGSVITSQGADIQNDKLLLNYDKISHDLYYSLDRQTVIEAERSRVKGFHLSAGDGKELDYTRVDLIKPEVFFQVFTQYDDHHYGLYSLTTTQFKKADYRTDGLVETGNNYDEYIDNVQYYIVSPGGKQYQPLELKKKSMRATFPAVKAQVEEYLSQHKNDDINETFLKGLVDFINHG
jgi:hypothetical protein